MAVAQIGSARYQAGKGDVFMQPEGRSSAGVLRGAMYAPSLGGCGTQASDAYGLYCQIFDQIADGVPCPVLSGDWSGCGVPSFGNAGTQTEMTNGRTWLQTTPTPSAAVLDGGGAKAGKVFLLCSSMGATVVFNWAARNPTLVAAIVGIVPLVDVDDYYSITDAAGKAQIDTPYGGNWATNGSNASPSFNPTKEALAGLLAGIPMQLWYSTADTSVRPATITTFASRVGGGCEINQVSGNPIHTDCPAAVASNHIPAIVSFLRANV